MQQCITSRKAKPTKKKFGGPNLGQNKPKSLVFGAQNLFQKGRIINFPWFGIAQDCRLGQSLTSSRAETLLAFY